MPRTRWRNKQEGVGRRKVAEKRGKTSEEDRKRNLLVVPSGDNLMTQKVLAEAGAAERKVNRIRWK